jgi:hypothetical protein
MPLFAKARARDQEAPPLHKPRWSQAHLEVFSHFSMPYLVISFWMIFGSFQRFFLYLFNFESLAVKCIGFQKFPAWGYFQYQTNICRRFQHDFQNPN